MHKRSEFKRNILEKINSQHFRQGHEELVCCVKRDKCKVAIEYQLKPEGTL